MELHDGVVGHAPVTVQETREGEFEELQHQVAILEGGLTASRKEAEVAVARCRAQARVLLRKVKASASAQLQVPFLPSDHFPFLKSTDIYPGHLSD